MVWQQTRAVQVEGAERARVQAGWILTGALDWGRLILREDARSGGPDHLGEVWATPLAEARLSTFLATDRNNTLDGGPEAFLSGAIRDAQSRYNLRNLVVDGKLVPEEAAVLRKLCETAGVGADTAELIAAGLVAASQPGNSDGGAAGADKPLLPQTVAQLEWLGIDAQRVQRLAEYVDLLPARTPVNLNTASREVLVAVLDGIDPGSAERLLQARQRQPFKSMEEARTHIKSENPLDPNSVAVASRFFVVSGRLRLDERVLEERALVERRGQQVVQLTRTRLSLHDQSR
jgi:general secretion pathway protein K